MRTKTEFIHFINEFKKSSFRLHISCYDNNSSLRTTFDSISFKELGIYLAPALDKRRLFMSACSSVNAKLASTLLSVTECYSIMGPCEDTDMDDLAILWASFYHLMFSQNRKSMKKSDLRETIKKLVILRSVKMKYYSSSKKAEKGWKEIILNDLKPHE